MAAWCRAYGRGRLLGRSDELSAPLVATNRAEGDALAAWQHWHGAAVDAYFIDREWPWYRLLEQARVETLASRDLPGMARNLGHPEVLSPADPTMSRLYQAARRIFAGQADTVASILTPTEQTQALTGPRLSLFGLRWPWQKVRASLKVTPAPPSDADIAKALIAARNLLADGPAFAEALRPLVKALSDLGVRIAPRSPTQPDDAVADADILSTEERPSAAIERPGGLIRDFTRTDAFPGYTVFSRAWDEEHPAAHWYRPNDAAALQGLDTLDRQQVRRLAHRLQRRLLAARLRHWSFDQDEGRLDSRRLARLAGTRSNQRIFRIEQEAPVPEACVTLLVDQSGSMRGLRQRMAALAIDLAVHTLELCQVRCEVLGYTTRFGANNPVSQSWRKLGDRSPPGRLNALRHILYKSAEQPWRRARPQLGLLMRAGFGYENIDGEALDWGARRLLRQPQTRKVLVVLSDGSPYDEATASANGRQYLEDHLRTVIAGIESSPIQLVAIGTGQEVGRFYRKAVTVRRSEAVAEVLFEHLGDLLTQPGAGQRL
jgi:cobaltochelatase CobT